MAASDFDVVKLAATTSADQSSEFTVRERPVTVYIYGTHVNGEYADLQREGPDDSWRDEYIQPSGGVSEKVRLSGERTAVTVYGAGTYRIDKEATTNAIGVAISEAPGR